MQIETITIEQINAGDTISLNADGSNAFVVRSIRDGMKTGIGFRTTDGEYAKFPFGMRVTRVIEDEPAAPVFVMDSAGFHVGVGDEVRVGQGYVLWTIDSVDGDTLHMTDALTGRRRHLDRGKVTLSIEGTDAYAARAAQGLFNIF